MNVWFLFVIMLIGILIFTFTFLYDLWSPVMAEATPALETFVNDSNAPASEKTKALDNFQNVRNVWRFWPYVLVFFLIIWAIAATQKVEPVQYRY